MLKVVEPLLDRRTYTGWVFAALGAACWLPAGMVAVAALLPDWPRGARTAIFAVALVGVVAAAGLMSRARQVCEWLANRLLGTVRPSREREMVRSRRPSADAPSREREAVRSRQESRPSREREVVRSRQESRPSREREADQSRQESRPSREREAAGSVGARRFSSRARTSVWLVVHAATGAVVVLVTGLLVLSAVALPAMWLNGGDTFTYVVAEVSVRGDGRGAWTLAAALAQLLLAVYLVAGAAASWRWLASRLLGPDASERLAAVEEQAKDLARRNRLAQELHDSIGHTLTTSTIQAAVANQLMETDPVSARRALSTIEESTRLALDDLDHVLGVLRRDATTREPERTLTDVVPLLDRIEASGTRVRRELGEGLAAVTSTVSREAYRLVQEAVTNVLRHAPGEAVDIALRIDGDQLRVDVANRLASSATDVAGRGLTGAAERVRLLGGEFAAGPDSDGTRWTLSARLPLPR